MSPAHQFDYYQELEVAPTAALADIVSAYRRLSRIHHPDKATSGDKAAATAKMARLNHAREILTDAEERRKYDEEMLREVLIENERKYEQAMGEEDRSGEEYEEDEEDEDVGEMDCDEVPEDEPARYAPVDDPTLKGDVSGDFGLGGFGLWEKKNRAGQAYEFGENEDEDEIEDEDEKSPDRITPDSPEEQAEVQPQPVLREHFEETMGPVLDALEVEEELEKKQKTQAKKRLWQTLVEDIRDTKRRAKERGLLPDTPTPTPTPSALRVKRSNATNTTPSVQNCAQEKSQDDDLHSFVDSD